MGYGSIDERSVRTCYSSHHPAGPNPRPPNTPILTSSGYRSKRLSRSGTNSPWSKAGILYTPVKTVRKYRTVIGYRSIPVKRYRYVYSASAGRRVRISFIAYKKQKIWGYKVRVFTKIVKTKLEPHILLKPNRLQTESQSCDNEAALSVAAMVTGGDQLGSTATAEGSGVQQFKLNAYMTSYMGTNVDSSVPVVPNALLEQARRKALFELYTRVADGYANVANMLAEAHKTVGLAEDILGAGLAVYRSLRRLNVQVSKLKRLGLVKEAKELLRSASSLWLSWVYGVSPLLSDIESLVKEAKSQDVWRKYTATAEVPLEPQYTGTNGGYWRYTKVTKTSAIVKCQATMSTHLVIPSFAKRHGFHTPEATLWEVIPFSFIVDWFIPIGAFLSSQKSIGSDLIFYHNSTLITYERTYEVHYGGANSSGSVPFVITGSSQKAEVKGAVFTRNVPSYPPQMPTPKFDVSGLTVRRFINAVAIAAANWR